MAVTVFVHPEKAYAVFPKRADCMEQARNARSQGFELEALVIVHSLMENSAYALLFMLGIPFKAADRIFQCLEYLKMHIADGDIDADAVLILKQKFIENGFLDRLYEWRKQRNEIVHDYAVGSFSKDQLDQLAAQGIELCEWFMDVVEEVGRNL